MSNRTAQLISDLATDVMLLSEEQKHEAVNDLCSLLGIERNPTAKVRQSVDTSYIKEHAAQLYDVSQKLASALNAGGRVELPKHWHKVPFRLEKLAEALADLSEEQKHEAINDLCSQLGIDRNPSYPDFNKWIKLHLKSPQNCGHYMIDAEELRQFIATGVLDK